jgi:amino acid adenylation domain-containing protein
MSTLIDLISDHIVLSPERCAVKCEGREYSYSELGHRVDCLANHLLAMSSDRNVLVAVMMDRTLEMLVALLGIMKAGHAYLPIDPSFPVERINYMLEHSRVGILVGDRSTYDRVFQNDLSQLSKLSFIDLPDTLQHQSEQPVVAENHARESDLAYVIYTSGSTGLPKGVMIPHRAVYNLLTSMARRPGFSDKDVLAAVTTLSFDISVLELFLPLCTGGCVVIVSKTVAADGEQLANLLAREPVTVMQATPSTWRMLQDSGWNGNKELKVLVGGEAAPRSVIEKLVSQCGEVWNMYGPTETTVWSSCSRIANENNITIGDAIDNTSLHVLDEKMQPVQKESEGLLYIGGKGLAEGYLFQDDLTSERFVEHINEPGEKIYNTGDVVFMRADGDIEYRRRADNQVKLRGFRIELGEIESRLNDIKGIFQSVVTVSDDKAESELVAYITETGDTTLTLPDIRNALSQHLPDYMIPGRFLVLEEMPLTPNGKIDRNNLPKSAQTLLLSQQDYLAPRNEMEAKIAEIWQQILDMDGISIDADFYELGGHSLLITRIWTRLNAQFGKKLPLGKLFDLRTIAELAAEMQNLSEDKEAQMAIPVVSRMKAPIMSTQQQRFWYIDQIAPQECLYNLCSAFNFKGSLSIEILQECLNRIIQRHEILRTSLDWTSDQPKQLITKKIHFELPIEDLSGLSDDEKSPVLTGFARK